MNEINKLQRFFLFQNSKSKIDLFYFNDNSVKILIYVNH